MDDESFSSDVNSEFRGAMSILLPSASDSKFSLLSSSWTLLDSGIFSTAASFSLNSIFVPSFMEEAAWFSSVIESVTSS